MLWTSFLGLPFCPVVPLLCIAATLVLAVSLFIPGLGVWLGTLGPLGGVGCEGVPVPRRARPHPWQEAEGTPWLIDHVCLERPGGYGSPAWERQGGASRFDDSNLHFEHVSFLCCGNEIPYLLIKGSVFFSYVLGGWGGRGSGRFPVGSFLLEGLRECSCYVTAAGRAGVEAECFSRTSQLSRAEREPQRRAVESLRQRFSRMMR